MRFGRRGSSPIACSSRWPIWGIAFPTIRSRPAIPRRRFSARSPEIGARERYRPLTDRARAQIARELDLIDKLHLAGYFLIVWDIVNFCRQHDILVQGRGSAANSAVCYSLGITAVDPVGMDLLFERFLSEERGEWPDIDLDLPSGDRRERVIQHVYEKYGRLGAAMTANVITYRGRSAAREVGKALGFEPLQIDRLAKVMNNFEFTDPADTLPRHLSAVGLDLNSERVRLFARLWGEMQDLPRHLGQHSGGMVICQGQLDAVVPLENASMPGRVVVQWDKDDCADMGIVKVDLLGLGMMAAIQDALALVNGERDNDQRGDRRRRECFGKRPLRSSRARVESSSIVDLAHLPQDPAVYQMLTAADTIGVFQVESRAQMATLPRLKPVCFYDLVVQVAIIRPGPIVGQMVHPYLNRRAGREPVRYPHPTLEPILARTLGVPLFQEQLLRMAMVAAGFTGGQAEELRRAFGFKRSERRMKQVEVQLRDGMTRQGISGAAAEEIITVDHVVRALRLPRVACGELRPAGVRERVSQAALSGRVLHRAAQQPADGVLPCLDAGQGRAAPRRAVPPHRRAGVRLGLHDRGGRRHPARAPLCERLAGTGRTSDRGQPSVPGLQSSLQPQAPAPSRRVPQMRLR